MLFFYNKCTKEEWIIKKENIQNQKYKPKKILTWTFFYVCCYSKVADYRLHIRTRYKKQFEEIIITFNLTELAKHENEKRTIFTRRENQVAHIQMSIVVINSGK